MASAQLLNQINEIRETELWIHHSSFIITTTPLNKYFVLAQGESLPHWLGATFVAVFVLVYRLTEFPLSAVTNRPFSYSTKGPGSSLIFIKF